MQILTGWRNFSFPTESAVLFPEYIRRTVKQGMDEASIMGKVAAAVHTLTEWISEV